MHRQRGQKKKGLLRKKLLEEGERLAVFRVVKDKDNPYIMINKYYIYDNRLSLKAKGLISYFLSRPDDWEFYQNEILKHCTDRKDSLSNAINELVQAGYIERTFKRGEKGKLKGGYDYAVHEIPNSLTQEKNTCTKEATESGFSEIEETRNRENPKSENPPLLNNESKLSNEIDNSSSKDNIEVFKYFEKCNFGLLSPMLMEKIAADIEIYGPTWVMKAAEIADEESKHTYSYVKGILENWKAKGKITLKEKKGGTKDGSVRQNTETSPYDFSKFGG